MKSDMTRILTLSLEEEEARALSDLLYTLRSEDRIPNSAIPFVNKLIDYLEF